MEHEQTENRLVLVSSHAATNTIGQTMADLARSITDENERLTEDLMFLEDALAFRGIEECMPVEFVTCVLADKDGISKFMESLAPESKMRNNYFAVIKILTCLIKWQSEGVIYQRDTIREAIDALMGRVFENMQLLGNLS